MINYTRDGAHTGDMYYKGKNPRYGAAIDYYLKDSVDSKNISLKIYDMEGSIVSQMKAKRTPGVNRVYWNLRYKDSNTGTGRASLSGPLVLPGTYVAQLVVNGTEHKQNFKVSDDPRYQVDLGVRKQWTASQWDVIELAQSIRSDMKNVSDLTRQMNKLDKEKVRYNKEAAAPLVELNRKYRELQSRTRTLYYQIGNYVGPWTADQQSQYDYYLSMKDKLFAERDQLLKNTLPEKYR